MSIESLSNIADKLRWQPAVPVIKRRGVFQLPAFSVDELPWDGASVCVRQYNFTSPQPFKLLELPTIPDPCNFGLVIKYRMGDDDDNVKRFLLWDNPLAVIPNVNLYNNDIIYPYFSLEVWTTQDSTSVSNATAIDIVSSLLVVPTLNSFSDSLYQDAVSVEETNPTTIKVVGRETFYGHGSPEGVVTANAGNVYIDVDTGTVYVKQSGIGTNTGWTG